MDTHFISIVETKLAWPGHAQASILEWNGILHFMSYSTLLSVELVFVSHKLCDVCGFLSPCQGRCLPSSHYKQPNREFGCWKPLAKMGALLFRSYVSWPGPMLGINSCYTHSGVRNSCKTCSTYLYKVVFGCNILLTGRHVEFEIYPMMHQVKIFKTHMYNFYGTHGILQSIILTWIRHTCDFLRYTWLKHCMGLFMLKYMCALI